MFNDELFQQVDGVSMGGPLAPSFANSFLAHLENNKITNCTTVVKPNLFLRYVDDCFALFKCNDDALTFLNFLNSLHPSISFTIEKGGLCMPFLDVDVKIIDHTFVTSVFRKLTHTGVFLNYFSIAPTSWKRGLIFCLLNRAKLICSSSSLFDTEVNKLKNMFISNCYPATFFEFVLKKFLRKFDCANDTDNSTDDCTDNDLPFVIFRVPYLGKCSVDFAKNISSYISRNFPVRIRCLFYF